MKQDVYLNYFSCSTMYAVKIKLLASLTNLRQTKCSILVMCLSPVHKMKLLSATLCCRQKFHGVYVRETCFKRFLWFMKLFHRIGHCSIS